MRMKEKKEPKLPPQDTARDMWLLTPLGSIGRRTIEVAQYEELRALAVKLAHKAEALVNKKLEEAAAEAVDGWIHAVSLDDVKITEKMAALEALLPAALLERKTGLIRPQDDSASSVCTKQVIIAGDKTECGGLLPCNSPAHHSSEELPLYGPRHGESRKKTWECDACGWHVCGGAVHTCAGPKWQAQRTNGALSEVEREEDQGVMWMGAPRLLGALLEEVREDERRKAGMAEADKLSMAAALLRDKAKNRRNDASSDRLSGHALDRADYTAGGLEEAAYCLEDMATTKGDNNHW